MRWRVGRRAGSLLRGDAAGRLPDGGRWRTSGRSTIDTRDDFPTTEAGPYFRFGIADVRAPGELPAGGSVPVKVVVTSSVGGTATTTRAGGCRRTSAGSCATSTCTPPWTPTPGST